MLELLVQTATGTSAAGNTTVTFANNTVAGNSIIVIAGNTSTTPGNITGLSDNQGNLYTRDLLIANVLLGELEVWHSSGIVGGSSPTITATYTSGLPAAIIAREYYGTVYSNMLDLKSTATGSSTTLLSGNTTSLTQNYELLIGAGLMTLGNTYTAGGSFVNLATLNAPLTVSVATEDLLVTGGGVQSASLGTNVSSQWACAIATFFLLPTGTTTSTSSTSVSSTSVSSTSSSTSSTSSSTSVSSTSISSTTVSTSSTSSSTSTSSTSTSASSTSSSTSSTSISSTSSSTSFSSTSSSFSSTSSSSTSISSTSSSTSFSSTSSSFSSTSSSISSTSISMSSTSFSSTSSSSSTSTTTLPPPFLTYSFQDVGVLPTTNTNLVNPFTTTQYSNASIDDGDYQIISGSQYLIKEFKQINKNNTDNISMTWKGRTTLAPTVSPLLIQIYNINSSSWETLATNTTNPADVDFQVTVTKTTNISNYYDSRNQVSFRAYQKVI